MLLHSYTLQIIDLAKTCKDKHTSFLIEFVIELVIDQDVYLFYLYHMFLRSYTLKILG